MHVESKTSQFEIVVWSLARFNTQFIEKKVLNVYLLQKLRALGDKSRNILATKIALNFERAMQEYGPLITDQSQRVK